MDKHTPGPWFVGVSADNHTHCVDAIDPTDEGTLEVCEVWGTEHDKTESETSKANAHLIATSPELFADLLEAATTLRRYEALHRVKNTEESTAKAEVNAELAARFEATIAKARGEV